MPCIPARLGVSSQCAPPQPAFRSWLGKSRPWGSGLALLAHRVLVAKSGREVNGHLSPGSHAGGWKCTWMCRSQNSIVFARMLRSSVPQPASRRGSSSRDDESVGQTVLRLPALGVCAVQNKTCGHVLPDHVKAVARVRSLTLYPSAFSEADWLHSLSQGTACGRCM